MGTTSKLQCQHCCDADQLSFDFTMAFQPIINCKTRRIFGYEALVRGLHNESAHSILTNVAAHNRYAFDQQCRVKAIRLAAQLGLKTMLSINFLPNAIYQPERCIHTTLATARQCDFPIEQIMFEFTEVEKFNNTDHIKNITKYYQSLGFKTATDDFGSGNSGLNLLAEFQPDIVKIDMDLIRDIHIHPTRQIIVTHCLAMFDDLNITALAEGVESNEEFRWLQDAGIELMQGYLFAKPGFEHLPSVDFSAL
ncbi:EAL domain-containing protein [Celerinatantimonas yamalensis]|uniref:EAL domain-containing protein n=1 Tax=Celerinatantimonas yamalensis TaxID=559956 RepID=A0ABW9G725_9GAMM